MTKTTLTVAKIKKTALCGTLLALLMCLAAFTLTGCGNKPSAAQPVSDNDARVQVIEEEKKELTAEDVKLMLERGETVSDGDFAAPIHIPTPSGELGIPHSGGWNSLDDSICTVSDSDIITGSSIGDACIWRVDEKGDVHTATIRVRKAAYLTIDDWPNTLTPKILNVLKEYNVKATFFLLANSHYPSFYTAIKEDGHAIGNHSYSHATSSMYKSQEALLSQFRQMDEYLLKEIDVKTDIIRLPGGSVNKNISYKRIEYVEFLRQNGYRVFDWTTSLSDSSRTITPEQSTYRVTKDCTDDFEMILMHHKRTSLNALPSIIKNLRAKDYEFFPITDSTPEYTF